MLYLTWYLIRFYARALVRSIRCGWHEALRQSFFSFAALLGLVGFLFALLSE